jgi:uncharacterized membrane protein YphA (DoxX/SURF4 family)
MSTLVWILSLALAAVFAGSGVAKLTMSRERLIATGQTGIAVYPMPVVRFTAACEILGAVALVAPWALGVARALTPAAAVGLAVVMVGAAFAHTKLREPWSVAANAVLFAACVWVAVARLGMLAS